MVSQLPSDALPHPVLVGDVGGTHCRLAVVPAPGAAPVPLLGLSTRAHETATEALSLGLEAARSAGHPVRALALAVAAPVQDGLASLTNAHWQIDTARLVRDLEVEAGLILNDFEALACALADVSDQHGLTILPARAGAPQGSRLILGPGTGFGAAALARCPGRGRGGDAGGWQVVPTEAGHMQLGPVSALEREIWPALLRVAPEISIETVLSGSGLSRLHAAVRLRDGYHLADLCPPDEVHRRALAGEPEACAAIHLFGGLLARIAGDLALAHLATGGVWIGGGIVPRLIDLFDLPQWPALFTAKPPMQDLLASIPLTILTAPAMAETGLANVAVAPERFGMSARISWRQASRNASG